MEIEELEETTEKKPDEKVEKKKKKSKAKAEADARFNKKAYVIEGQNRNGGMSYAITGKAGTIHLCGCSRLG